MPHDTTPVLHTTTIKMSTVIELSSKNNSVTHSIRWIALAIQWHLLPLIDTQKSCCQKYANGYGAMGAMMRDWSPKVSFQRVCLWRLWRVRGSPLDTNGPSVTLMCQVHIHHLAKTPSPWSGYRNLLLLHSSGWKRPCYLRADVSGQSPDSSRPVVPKKFPKGIISLVTDVHSPKQLNSQKSNLKKWQSKCQ